MSDSGGRPRAADAHGAVRQAIQLHVDGRLESAVDAYRAVLKMHSKEAACWPNLGVALRRLGRGGRGGCSAEVGASHAQSLWYKLRSLPW